MLLEQSLAFRQHDTGVERAQLEESLYYVNFEDDRFLGFQAEETNDLYQVLLEERMIFVVDEVQNSVVGNTLYTVS